MRGQLTDPPDNDEKKIWPPGIAGRAILSIPSKPLEKSRVGLSCNGNAVPFGQTGPSSPAFSINLVL